MLREVSESLFDFLIEAFPTEKSYTRSDIEQDPMPPLMAHFLGQSLQHRLDVEIEHLRTVRSSWFDYEHADVQQAYKSFVAALAKHAHVPSEEWRSTLKRATKLVIAHLVLPTHTLVEFVFREEEGPLASSVISREISYFAAYPYLREAVEAFLKKRDLQEIDRTRFSSLLTQIDRHMTASYGVDQWMRMLRPLFDLMRRVPQTRNQGVPIDLLSMFFGDKEAYEIQGRLQVEKEVHRISALEESGLRRVMEGSVGPFEQELKPAPPAKPVAPRVSQPDSQDATITMPSYLPREDAPRPAAPPAPEPAPDEEGEKTPKPLWARFQQNPSSKDEPAAKEAPKKNQDKDASVPLWMQFQKSGSAVSSDAKQPGESQESALKRTMTSETRPLAPQKTEPFSPIKKQHPTPSSYPFAAQDQTREADPENFPQLEKLEISVLGSFGANNRDMFIDDLFAGSSDAYERLLAHLERMNNWEDASQLIAEEVFKRYNINIYSPAAILFTESVEEQFRQQ